MQYVLQAAFLLTLLVYVVFSASIGIMAFIHRRQGWGSAVLFSLMLLSMPVWIGLMYFAYIYFSGASAAPFVLE